MLLAVCLSCFQLLFLRSQILNRSLSLFLSSTKKMISYIKKVHGFEDHNITVLMDDGKHTPPTKSNILNAYRNLVEECLPGDAVFCHFAGHGGKIHDTSGDEDDGYDETMIPIDFKESGHIVDDELFATLICPMPAGGMYNIGLHSSPFVS